MKKKHFLFSAAALLLASCSQTDELGLGTESAKQQITFDAPYVNVASAARKAPGTRGTGDLGNANIQANKLYVYGEMDGATVFDEKDGDGGITELTYSDGWKTDKLAFWEKNKTYNFYATSVKANFNTNDKKIIGVPVVQEIDNESDPKKGDDIIVATTPVTVTETNASPVALNFKHVLSRFSVYAYTDKATVNPVKVTSMKLYMPASTVTADYSFNSKWTTWHTSYTSNTLHAEADAAKAAGYDEYTLVSEAKELAACLVSPTKDNTTKLGNDYFIVPTGNNEKQGDDKLQFYMELTYKQLDETYTVFAPIQDLHSFTTGYQTNLFICITNPDLMAIKYTTLEVNPWQEDTDKTYKEW